MLRADSLHVLVPFHMAAKPSRPLLPLLLHKTDSRRYVIKSLIQDAEVGTSFVTRPISCNGQICRQAPTRSAAGTCTSDSKGRRGLLLKAMGLVTDRALNLQRAQIYLEEHAALQEGIRHRSIVPRVSGVYGIVALQPDMPLGNLQHYLVESKELGKYRT